MSNRGFTLLECMIALLLVSTALIIVVESQSFAVDVEQRTARMNVATMLAREIMTELDLRMVKEGFGELEIKERGDYSDERYDSRFDEYRWEYEVEKVDLDQMPDLSMLMGLASEAPRPRATRWAWTPAEAARPTSSPCSPGSASI